VSFYDCITMLLYLFVLFTIVPLVELALLIWIGGQTAWWVPIVGVVLTGVAGAALARWQGWRALQRIQDDMRSGRVPAGAVIDGVLILVAGILLVTPGVLTDVVGIALLIPPIRAIVKRRATATFRRHVEVRAARFKSTFRANGFASDRNSSPRGHDEIIEAKVIKSRVEDAD
jgi:UPF0716 protein FxsA